MQDANLNSGTPIFKIRILAHFVSNDFSKLPPYTRKMFLFQKPNSYWTLKCWNERYICMRLVAIWPKCQKLPHHPMQILVNFEIEGTCIRQSLPDTI